MPPDPTISQVAATGDPGDETAKRYAYQWYVAASLACGLLDDSTGIVEVFCEHHEDILVKRADGTYDAVQVKTRHLDAAPWKSSDEELLGAIGKFAKLEKSFGTQISKYVILTNHLFFADKTSASDLRVLIRLASGTVDAKAQKRLQTYASKVAKHSGADPAAVLPVLRKMRCDQEAPKLNHARIKLRGDIEYAYGPAAQATLTFLNAAVDTVLELARSAASLEHEQQTPLYLSGAFNSAAQEVARVIEGKRITAAKLRTRLEQVLITPLLLQPQAAGVPMPLPDGETKLEKKLTAGGLSVVTLGLAKDLQAAMLQTFLLWQNKSGSAEALKRYRHLKTLVKADCSTAFEKTRAPMPFGVAMLMQLRAALAARAVATDPQLFGCSKEHLEGIAYELTNACEVWWSEPFPIDGGQ